MNRRSFPRVIRELNFALARTPVHGARLPAGVLRLSGVEAPNGGNRGA